MQISAYLIRLIWGIFKHNISENLYYKTKVLNVLWLINWEK